MPRTASTARATYTTRPTSGVKSPERCPSCNSMKVAPKGTRVKKLETVRVYRCRSCGRTFTPGPRMKPPGSWPSRSVRQSKSPAQSH